MLETLTDDQLSWLSSAIGPITTVADLSWQTTSSSVLHIRDRNSRDLVLKVAGPPMENHIAREINAQKFFTAELSRTGDTQSLIAANEALGILVLSFIPGTLVQGGPHELDPIVHFQAGQLLRRLHQQGSRLDSGYQANLISRTRRWLEGPSRIPQDQVKAINVYLDAYNPDTSVVVPTHGDYHPRNWLVQQEDSGPTTRIIDFGRFDWRTAQSDLLRLWLMQWHRHQNLEEAFLAGYGEDPRGPSWMLELVHQSVANSCWAHMIGDAKFEHQGLLEVGRIVQRL